MNKGSDASKGPEKVEDSLGESGSHNGKARGITESYNSDTFEDNSLSGSGNKKSGIQYWQKKDSIDGSLSASQPKEEEAKVFSANAMEEYLKKQKEKGGAQVSAKPLKPVKDFSESSDKYTDEDFESISKS